MLHLVNGDSGLRKKKILPQGHRVLACRDTLTCGPLGPNDAMNHWLLRRQDYWKNVNLFESKVIIEGRKVAGRVKAASALTIWAGTVASEQLFAAWLLDLLEQAQPEPQVTLIQISPNARGMASLVWLTPAEQLKAALKAASPIDDVTRAAYVRAWRAWSASDPSALLDFLQAPTGPPPLAAALDAMRLRYPDQIHGLPHWDHCLLNHLSMDQPDIISPIARTLQASSEPGNCDHIGDVWLFHRLRRYAAAHLPTPLVKFDHDGDAPRDCQAYLTDAGHEVLAGRISNAVLNGYQDQIGGVQLNYPQHPLWLRTHNSLIQRGKAVAG